MCLQCSGDKADEIADDAPAESEEDGVAGALLSQKKVLDGGLSLARLGCLSGWDDMGDEAGCGGWVGEGVADVVVKGVGKEREVEGCDVGVCDEDVRRCRERREEGSRDVVVEVESAVDRVFAEDGDLMHVGDVSERGEGYLYPNLGFTHPDPGFLI